MDNNSPYSEKPYFPAKAAVVVDGGYWRKIIKEMGISSVDLVSLTDALCNPAFRIRTYFFDGKIQNSQSFHDNLQLLDRFEVYLGDVVPRPFSCPSCRETFQVPAQKRVDVALAVELVHLATTSRVDLIVLLAGDRDFIPAIETAKHAGVILRLVHGPPKTVSDTLFKLVDEKIELSLDYFKENHIKTVRRKKREFKPELIRKQEDEERIKVEKGIETITKTIETILLNLISKSSDNYIHLSRIGIELNKIEPKWKEKTQIKHLKDIIRLAERKFTLKVKNKHYYITTTRKISPEKITKKKVPDSVEKFIIEAITEHFTQNQSKSISIIKLGTLLHKKNPGWKQKYGIKQLKTALDMLGEKLIISGEQNEIIIKLP